MVKLSTIFKDNIRILHETAEKASAAHDISVVFEDLDGSRITREEDTADQYFVCDICKRTYRGKVDRNNSRLCGKSDLEATWKALGMRIDVPYLFACHFGFSNFLIPIKIGGSVAGNVFGGQFVVDRGSEKKATRRWVTEKRELILERWKKELKRWIQECEISSETMEQYKTAIEGFLKGPESGWDSIDRFYSELNNTRVSKNVDMQIADNGIADEMRKAVYGLNLDEEVRRLLNRCFGNSRLLTERYEKLTYTEGLQPPPADDDEKTNEFLDRLIPDTEIDIRDKRIDFIRRYSEDIEYYRKSENLRAKDLTNVLKVIEKLYSEAQILSQLGNERLYLNLYEGLASRIPPIVRNECEAEMEWINHRMRGIIEIIGDREKTLQEHPKIETQEMNAKFFKVLTKFQEYQHSYTRRFWRRFENYSKTVSDSANAISNFFSTYIQSMVWCKTIGEKIDRCERIYLSVIGSQSLEEEKAKLVQVLGEQKEKRRLKEYERAEAEEEERQKIYIELTNLDQQIEEMQKEIQNKDKKINDIEEANGKFLQMSNKCKKVNEELDKLLRESKVIEVGKEADGSPINEDIRSFIKNRITQLKAGSSYMRLESYASTIVEALAELKKNHELMISHLMKLEEAEGKKYNVYTTIEDQHSIAIISLKDKFIEGLLWVNDCLSKLLEMEHKRDFHVRFDIMYFNAGGLAPVHTDIERAQEKWMIQRDESGAVSEKTEKRIGRELTITRKFMSLLLGVDKEEVVLTDSTTEGLYLVLQAIRFEKGDQIITSNAEHDVVRYLVSDLIEKYERFHGINISWEKEGFPVEKIPQQVTSQTRLVLFSDIVFTTGDRHDVKEIISKCREKYKEAKNIPQSHKSLDILFLIDGAQSAGQTPLNLKDMGCDFFAMDGHKWLLASEGSGALYVKKDYLEKKDPNVHFTFIKNYMVVNWKAGFHPKISDKGRSYELATINLPSKIGLRTAVQIIARDGLEVLIGNRLRLSEQEVDNILDDCFDDYGELKKKVDAKVLEKLEDLPTDTETFLKKCLSQGISDIKAKIDDLKVYFRNKLSRLEEELKKNSKSKVTIKVVTKKDNEGGVVGFQLINNETKVALDWPYDGVSHQYEIHEKFGKMLQDVYGIIFRVIPPPYPPAIRVCLHKYNTRSEIDILYHALLESIPSLEIETETT